MESALRPREIQARIRSGQTPDAVAAAAGVPVERIEPFALPVIAEREHVAGLAQESPVRRTGEIASQRGLRSSIAERLATRGIEIEDVTWDAWRRNDGRWSVRASFRSGVSQHDALFSFDMARRFSVAENDDARWLINEASAAHGPQPGRRRRADETADEPTLDLDDERSLAEAVGVELPPVDPRRAGIRLVPPPANEPKPAAVVAEVPRRESNPEYELDALFDIMQDVNEDSVRIYTGLDPEAPIVPATRPPKTVEAELPPPELVTEPEAVLPAQPAQRPFSVAAHEAALPETQVEPTAASDAGPAKRKPKRATVPSWDEIMFGSPGREKRD